MKNLILTVASLLVFTQTASALSTSNIPSIKASAFSCSQIISMAESNKAVYASGQLVVSDHYVCGEIHDSVFGDLTSTGAYIRAEDGFCNVTSCTPSGRDGE